MNSKIEDRRRHVRVIKEVCAWLSFKEDCAAYATLTEDLGPLGAQFCALRNVGVSEKLSIDFQFPSKNIGCEANVRWVRPSTNGKVNFGVQFINLSDGEREYLLKFLSKSVVV